MPNGLKAPPEPLKVVDAIGDVIMHAPRLPAEVVQRAGAAGASMGTEMEAAVKRVTDIPGDVLPDPITFVTGALDYVFAVPKGAVGVVKGVADGVAETLSGVQQRLRRLGG